jgi:hypothetical protein
MYLSYLLYPPLASLGRFVHLYVTSSYWSRFKSGQRSGRHSSSTLSVFCNTATLKIAPSFVVPTWVTPMVYSRKMLRHSLNPQRPRSRRLRTQLGRLMSSLSTEVPHVPKHESSYTSILSHLIWRTPRNIEFPFSGAFSRRVCHQPGICSRSRSWSTRRAQRTCTCGPVSCCRIQNFHLRLIRY